MPRTSTKRHASSSNANDGCDTQYYLLKSEPSDYSIHDMERDGREEWDGIRNYQARNHLRAMKVGDKAFFYHSKSSPPGIVGTVKIVRTARPDPTAYDPQSEYYDPKSSEESCRWDSVLVEYEQTFPEMLSLKELKDAAAKEPEGAIANLALLKQSRLSVVPVTAVQWEEVMSMINKKNSGNGIETGGEKRRRKT